MHLFYNRIHKTCHQRANGYIMSPAYHVNIIVVARLKNALVSRRIHPTHLVNANISRVRHLDVGV